MLRTPPRQPGVRAVAPALLALLLSGLALVGAAPASAATTPTTSDPADAAAGWLARQFVAGDHLVVSYGGTDYPDVGLTADGVLALDAARTAQTTAAAATQWIESQAKSYTGASSGEAYAGAYAKLLLLADAQHADPRSFGGLDLVSALQSREQPDGRFTDQSSYGDYSNGITQSLAVLALQRATADGPDAKAVNFLASAQCTNGGFPEQFGQATCTSDVDTTGYAVQALLAAGRTAVADKAVDWLVSIQASNGGFVSNGVANSNSTGLAGQALRVGGRTAAANKADAFLLSLQDGCSATADKRGAVEYDAIRSGDAVRATTQAVPALAGVGLAGIEAGGAAAAPTLACTAVSPTPSPTPTASAPATPRPTTTTSTTEVRAVRASAELPDTGDTSTPLVVLGTALLLAGAGLLVAGRKGRRAA